MLVTREPKRLVKCEDENWSEIGQSIVRSQVSRRSETREMIA